MSISAKLVMELRAKTNAGMMDCKKALIENNGDMEAAVLWLREKGISKAAKKASRIAAEGLVFEASNDEIAALVEFNSETDFVAKNEEFIAFGQTMANLILENEISNVEELKALKIEDSNVETKLTDMIAKIGENMNIRRLARVKADGFITTYLHMGGKIGVILNMTGEATEENKEKAKDVAMHVAAMSPDFLDKSEVTEEILEKEKSIMKAQLLEEGKPENIIDKILIGKMNKFYEENCLLQQKFVKDDKITIAQYLGKDLGIKEVVRFKLGEGLEKRNEDFAAEVAAQMN
ncbi:MAG: translation elongation factor Ts [Candidatus Cloacimonetes bacterium]|nr:translation elongation factor Ts [Candidatus Cloacimonadota bacterium]MCF7813067.1 translation elongation factor Ts [Candidatus Cloacimonadota bacterium]MCF7867192.1 translation elongation factor Ts [Candidatus Cloacimonadota bacterium]MCF7882636.1 translation elongation factor Ts [Candidatus Cloacimonadota bacterium]